MLSDESMAANTLHLLPLKLSLSTPTLPPNLRPILGGVSESIWGQVERALYSRACWDLPYLASTHSSFNRVQYWFNRFSLASIASLRFHTTLIWFSSCNICSLSRSGPFTDISLNEFYCTHCFPRPTKQLPKSAFAHYGASL